MSDRNPLAKPSLAELQQRSIELTMEFQRWHSRFQNASRTVAHAMDRLSALHDFTPKVSGLFGAIAEGSAASRAVGTMSTEIAYWLVAYEQAVPKMMEARDRTHRLTEEIEENSTALFKASGGSIKSVAAIFGDGPPREGSPLA